MGAPGCLLSPAPPCLPLSPELQSDIDTFNKKTKSEENVRDLERKIVPVDLHLTRKNILRKPSKCSG